jgi:hypothetical protein
MGDACQMEAPMPACGCGPGGAAFAPMMIAGLAFIRFSFTGARRRRR